MSIQWLASAAQAGGDAVRLEPAGLVVMVLSVAIVTGLTLFCIIRILRESSPSAHYHAPLDIDTHGRSR